MRFSSLFVLASICVLMVTLFPGGRARNALGQEKPQKPDTPIAAKWEYRIVEYDGGGGVPDHKAKMEETLNKLAEEGFEIAFMTSTAPYPGPRGGWMVHFVLKRIKK